MSSTFRYLNLTELANTGPLGTLRRCYEKRTTSNNRKNTTSTKSCLRRSAGGEIISEFSTWSNGSTIRNERIGRKNHLTTSRYAVWRNSESFIDEIRTRRGTTGYPNSFTGSAAESPAVEGRGAGGPRTTQSLRNIEPERPEAVGVRYDTPLSEHLRGNSPGTNPKSRKSLVACGKGSEKHHMLPAAGERYVSEKITRKLYDRVPTFAKPGGRIRHQTPLCAHHWLVRLVRAWSLLPCTKFTEPRPIMFCNTPTVGSRTGRETTQI